MRKESFNFEELKEKFVLVSNRSTPGELAMRDDRNCLAADFRKGSGQEELYIYKNARLMRSSF